VDLLNAESVTMEDWLTKIGTGNSANKSIVQMTHAADPTKFAYYYVSVMASPTGYKKYTVEYIAGGGSFTADDKIWISFVPISDPGDPGATGPTGESITGPTGESITGPTGNDGVVDLFSVVANSELVENFGSSDDLGATNMIDEEKTVSGLCIEVKVPINLKDLSLIYKNVIDLTLEIYKYGDVTDTYATAKQIYSSITKTTHSGSSEYERKWSHSDIAGEYINKVLPPGKYVIFVSSAQDTLYYDRTGADYDEFKTNHFVRIVGSLTSKTDWDNKTEDVWAYPFYLDFEVPKGFLYLGHVGERTSDIPFKDLVNGAFYAYSNTGDCELFVRTYYKGGTVCSEATKSNGETGPINP
jgi:hypothetical protein